MFDAYTFTCTAVLIALTALGVIINLVPEWSTIPKGEFSVVAMYWAAANIVVLAIAALICFEKPRASAVAFFIGEPAWAQFDGRFLSGRLVSLSLESGVAELPQDAPIAVGGEVLIEAAGFPLLPSRIEGVGKRGENPVTIRFRHNLDATSRDRLIVKLYTGDYSQEIRQLGRLAIIGGLWRRAFGRDAKDA